MAFARISPFQRFPGHTTRVDAETFEVARPMTFGGRVDVRQQIAFKPVPDDALPELRAALFRPAFPAGDANPPRIEVVETEEEARAIEQRDRDYVRREARGRGYVEITG